MADGEEKKTTAGTVEEVLPDSLFRVRVPSVALAKEGDPDDGGSELILAYLAGKMKINRIRVLMGDQVDMVLDPYGGRARIVRRLS